MLWMILFVFIHVQYAKDLSNLKHLLNATDAGWSRFVSRVVKFSSQPADAVVYTNVFGV